MDSVLARTGRYIYAVPFGIFGLFHFMNAEAMSGMVPLPGGIFWIYLTGIALLGASVAIIIQQKIKLVALLLGILLAIFALSIHLPGILSAESEMAMQASMSNMLKDLALSGAAFFMSAVYSQDEADNVNSED
ncbi:MAG: DoxX family protein [Balneolaceae bacterium]|nr:DoxX family protein [Balneolaceae bacterium]